MLISSLKTLFKNFKLYVNKYINKSPNEKKILLTDLTP